MSKIRRKRKCEDQICENIVKTPNLELEYEEKPKLDCNTEVMGDFGQGLNEIVKNSNKLVS